VIKLSRSRKGPGPLHGVDGIPHSLAQSAGQTANKLAGAVEVGGARVAKTTANTGGRVRRLRSKLHPNADVVLKSQLAKTSRELAHESSDLGTAVESLNAIIKKNRRAGAKARTRLLGGLAFGAALMYHLDPDHGRERRSTTRRLLANARRST
jgi:hypothetical protein